MENCKISIVIPLYNRVELTRKCWLSIQDHTKVSSPYEVVFIDNDSEDGTFEFLNGINNSSHPVVKIIRNSTNEGFAKACNQGARMCCGEIIVFLNNDTLVHFGWLPPLVEELDKNKLTGIVGGRLIYPDGRIQHAGVAINRRHIPYHLFQNVEFDDPLVTERRIFRMVTGACMAVRRNEFLSLKGFDEEYINGHEDVDLCLRYGEAGLVSVYHPDCVVTHFESQSEGRFVHCEENTQKTLSRWKSRLIQDDFNYHFPESEREIPEYPLSLAIKVPLSDRQEGTNPVIVKAEALARDLCLRGHACRIYYLDDWLFDDQEFDAVVTVQEVKVQNESREAPIEQNSSD